ncbi:MAG: hypothetical protein ABR532_03285, partial [Candidatus Dormibacteria bacterium]
MRFDPLTRLRHDRRLQVIAGVLVVALCAGLFLAFLVPRSPSGPKRLTDAGQAGSDDPGSAGSALSRQPGSAGPGSLSGGSAGSAGRAGKAGSAGSKGRPKSGPGSGVGRLGPGGVPLDGPEDGPGAPGNFASDTGVTDKRITLGFLRPVPTGTPISDDDLFNRPEHAYARDINGHGGIHGRNVQIIDEPFDPLLPSEVARACQDLKDNNAFAVLNEGYFDGRCLIANHIFFSHGGPASAGQYASGLEFSVSASAERLLRNWVQGLAARGDGYRIQGKNVGTVEPSVSDVTSQQEINQGFVGPLQGYGVNPTRTNPDCLNPSTIQLAVSRMKLAGVNAVFLMTDLCAGPAFINEANNQQFFPQYHTSDFFGAAEDFWAGQVTRRQGLNGALGMTSWRTGGPLVGQPERAVEAACRDRYRQQTAIGLSPDDTPDAQGNRTYEFAEEICGLMNDFAAGANINGGNLTRDRLSQAYRSLGTHQFPNNADITYSANKFDGGDSQRAVKWDEGCDSNNGCYKPMD